ncbi:hypothetical protein ACFL09_04535, partial [Planctomycetota bacterium]
HRPDGAGLQCGLRGTMARRPRRTRSARTRPPKSSSGTQVVVALFVGALLAGGIAFLLLAGRDDGRRTSGSSYVPRPEAVQRPVVQYADGDVARLAARLRAKRVGDRATAARALAAMGPRAAEAIPDLLDAMARRSGGIEVEMSIRRAFKAMGRAAGPTLIRARAA